MIAPSEENIKSAVEILFNYDVSQDEILEQLGKIASDSVTADRMFSFIPEAFGTVLLKRQVKEIYFAEVFTAFDSAGATHDLPLEREPIFGDAVRLGERMAEGDNTFAFVRVAVRSSVFNIATNAHKIGSLKGLRLTPIVFLRVPADIYV